MTSIIPKSKAKGTDICGFNDFFYIIRSDLGCYMQTTDFNKASDILIHSLHLSCKDGDHYLCDESGSFYIIKGNNYRKTKNLTTDSLSLVYTLHPNCRGGDHYFSTNGKFYILFQGKGTYRITTDMSQDSDAEELKLDPDYRNGLYYWGKKLNNIVLHFICNVTPNSFPIGCFIKPGSEWGVEYCYGLDFSKGKPADVLSVHPDIINFLPGGLSIIKGPAFGVWENIKTVTNHSNTPMTYNKKVTKKVGYNKEKMKEITHNWKIATSFSIETGALAALIAKVQFSFSAEYGGSHVNTEKESWDQATEEEEQLSFELKPNESVYMWQYRMGLGQESLLFCRDLKIDDEPNPPTEVPLPQSQW